MTKLDVGKYSTLLDTQKSDTTDAVYQIRWDKDNGYFCECQGWQSSKRKPKMCKHIRRFGFKSALYAGTRLDKEVIEIVLKTAKEIWLGVI